MKRGENRNIWVSLITVLTTGVVLGLFIWNTYLDYVPHLYPLKIKKGEWIHAPNESPQGYFRKEIYIPWDIKGAWIMLAAPDSFILYINGKELDTQKQAMSNVSGVYDIRSYLHPGKNVIGVKVTRKTYPGPAKVVIEGGYLDQTGREYRFLSDTSWKTSSYEESRGSGSIPWYKEEFYTDSWSQAKVSGVPLAGEISGVWIHPDLLTSIPRGKWIGHADPKVKSAIFYIKFEMTKKVQGAWVRIGSEGRYDLLINNISVSNNDPVDKTLDIYDVGQFLRRGTNIIQVNVTARGHSPPQLILDGFIAVSDQAQTILITDSTWKTKRLEPSGGIWEPATLLADYSPLVDGLVKREMVSHMPIVYAAIQTARMLACILLVVFITLLAWAGSSLLIRLIGDDITQGDALMIDALLHLPSLLFFSLIYLLQYDIHYDPAFPFQARFIYLALMILLVLRVGLLLEVRLRRSDLVQQGVLIYRVVPIILKYRALFFAICIIIIVASGIVLRLYNLDAESLSHDEVSMAILAEEVLERGYAVKTIGPIEKPSTTYELLPYPIALSIKIFGPSDFAVRLPAALFGTLTILLIYYIGIQLWGLWTGILAAAIYAFSPISILWGSNAFHPQQAQFFTLLTSYLFYKSIDIQADIIKPNYLYGASISFLITYLTWEGAGLLLPAFFSYLLVAKGRDLSWIKCRHLWLALGIVGLAVILQLSRRILSNVSYIIVGKGVSGESFRFFFLDPLYNPWFYIQNLLFAGNYIVLTILVLLGLPLIFKDQGIRYYFTLLVLLLVLLTNLLPHQSTRYAYFLQPFLILPAVAIAICLASSIWKIQGKNSSWMLGTAKGLFNASFLLIIFLSTNTLVLQLYRLGSSPERVTQMLPEAYWVDYRSTDRFIKDRLSPNDVIISLMPHTLKYYIDRRSNYYIQAYTDRPIFYDVSGSSAGYLDKYIGSPVIRNLAELKDVLNRHRRVWIIATPYTAFQSNNDEAIIEYIGKNSEIAYESYETRVYLWER